MPGSSTGLNSRLRGIDGPASRRPVGFHRFFPSGLLDPQVERTVPEDYVPQLREPLPSGLDRREMVSGQLSHLAREERGAVREEDLDLRQPARVEQELAGAGVRSRVLRADRQLELPAQRDPGCLAAPARLDELALQREQPAQGGDRVRSFLFLEPGPELEVADGEPEHGGTLEVPATVSSRR